MAIALTHTAQDVWSNRVRPRLINFKKSFRYENGKLYYDRKIERGALFFLTMLLLAWGLFDKL